MAFGAYDAAKHALRRAEQMLAHSRGGALPLGVKGDIRRQSVVMAVAALDTYMHRLIVERSFTHDVMPPKLAQVSMTFGQLVDQADATKLAAGRPAHATRPRVGVKRQLRDRLLRETFQRWDDVMQALAMAGQSGRAPTIAAGMAPAMTVPDVRSRLNAIVTRRNQIVHEGDYVRLDRPRTGKRNGMTFHEARSDVEFLARLIDAIHAAI